MSYKPSPFLEDLRPSRLSTHTRSALQLIGLLLLSVISATLLTGSPLFTLLASSEEKTAVVKAAWDDSLLKCSRLELLPGPPSDFGNRTESDRWVKGTPPTLIRNGTVWTGENEGHEILYSTDILLDRGLIVSIGQDLSAPKDARIIEAHGAFITPGIFDVHSHIGVDSLPELSGADDVNSVGNQVNPWLRSLDAINTHDLSYRRTVSGGVTTSLVLPGSANSIGGQAFAIKLRPTRERTPESLVLELPYNVPVPSIKWKKGDPPRWRHMKMACGENIRRVYKQTRQDNSWGFRSAFYKARKLKQEQDAYCAKAQSASAKGLVLEEKFPDDLQWEALVDVLRGKVLVNTHCYETTDLAQFIRHTNEFKFPVQAVHHAHEAYIVPDLLKQAYNHTPAVAIFGTNGRYKREAWRGSEYAARTLAENNITVITKSDHPVLDSRFVLFEAQQTHHFGLAENLALRAVTTAPATTAGFAHRLGHIRLNNDADLVLWDSHPLTLGATPLQVLIDGIPQLSHPHSAKPLVAGHDAKAPGQVRAERNPISWEEDDDGLKEGARNVFGNEIEWVEEEEKWVEEVVFVGVKEALVRREGELKALNDEEEGKEELFEVHVRDGEVVCVGVCVEGAGEGVKKVDLKGGSLLPPLVAFGPALGLTEIISEKSTTDAAVYDPLYSGELSTTQQLWGQRVAVRAIDGLSFGGKHLRIAHTKGITKAVTAPMGNGFFRGVSVAFRTNAANILDPKAIIKEVVALHVTIGHYKGSQTPSISTEIAELRALLLGGLTGADVIDPVSPDYFALAAKGQIPLVINAWKADNIATLVLLKKEIEAHPRSPDSLKWIIHGGQEAHLIADEIAAANLSVILSPPRAFPESWDERRAIPGPPLSPRNAPNILHNAGVKLGLGVPEEWQSMTLLWEAAWAWKNSNGEVGRKDAIGWISTGLEELLGLDTRENGRGQVEFVAHEGDPFEFGSRPVAVSSSDGKKVELLL